MKTTLLILTTFLFALQMKSQTKYSTVADDFIEFHTTISTAERMYKNDSLLQAYAKFDIAIENYKGEINPGHYFRAAICALKIREEFKALDFLEKAIRGGYEVDSNKIDDIVFNNQNTKKEYVANIKKWESERDAGRNTNWENEMYAYNEQNKKFNSGTYKAAFEYCANCMKNKSCSKTAPDYLSKYKMVKEKRKADSLVALNLLKNIKQFGFPNMKLMDKRACGFARNILLSYDSDKKNELLNDMFVKALKDGQISPEFYGTVIDRRNLLNGLAPEFFQPITGYEKTPPKDITIANEKRKTIGLYRIAIAPTAAKPKDKKAPTPSVITNLYDY